MCEFVVLFPACILIEELRFILKKREILMKQFCKYMQKNEIRYFHIIQLCLESHMVETQCSMESFVHKYFGS